MRFSVSCYYYCLKFGYYFMENSFIKFDLKRKEINERGKRRLVFLRKVCYDVC